MFNYCQFLLAGTLLLLLLVPKSFGALLNGAEANICEGNKEVLKCCNNLNVNITSAKFIQMSGICDNVVDGPVECVSQNLTQLFRNMCQNQNICTITANKSIAPIDPKCREKEILLKIEYHCSSSVSLIAVHYLIPVLFYVIIFFGNSI